MQRVLLLCLFFLPLAGFAQVQNKVYKVTMVKLAVTKEDMLKKFQLPSLNLNSPQRPNTLQSANAFCSCTTLSVSSITLQGERLDENTVKLDWKTVGELNTKGFDIERSFGNSSAFVKVAYSFPLNTTLYEKKYVANDPNNFEGTSFYRVKEIDINGKFTYSNTVHVNGKQTGEMLAVYPNPAHDIILLSITSNKIGSGSISYLDAAGKKVKSQLVDLKKGVNNTNVDISLLASGTYIVRLARPGEKDMVTKFVKEY